MAIVRVTLKGDKYQQRHYYETEKLDRESHEDYETRTWRDSAHCDGKGMAKIPGACFVKALASTARRMGMQIKGKGKSTYTKHFVAGVLAKNDLELGVKKDKIIGEPMMVPSDGKPGGGKRVKKYFPTFINWEGDIEFIIMDNTITEHVFKTHLVDCGQLTGIGVWRPEKGGCNGRFTVKKFEWIETR